MITAGSCDSCGHVSARLFTVVLHDGTTGRFDAFECAFHTLAPRCSHCGTTMLGHGVQVGGQTFCCSHCARLVTDIPFDDPVGTETDGR